MKILPDDARTYLQELSGKPAPTKKHLQLLIWYRWYRKTSLVISDVSPLGDSLQSWSANASSFRSSDILQYLILSFFSFWITMNKTTATAFNLPWRLFFKYIELNVRNVSFDKNKKIHKKCHRIWPGEKSFELISFVS